MMGEQRRGHAEPRSQLAGTRVGAREIVDEREPNGIGKRPESCESVRIEGVVGHCSEGWTAGVRRKDALFNPY